LFYARNSPNGAQAGDVWIDAVDGAWQFHDGRSWRHLRSPSIVLDGVLDTPPAPGANRVVVFAQPGDVAGTARLCLKVGTDETVYTLGNNLGAGF
jgi:hypothetical protein